MTWTCPNCDRDYPDSSLGVPRPNDADDKDGCMVCFVSPIGISTFENPKPDLG